MCSPKHRILRLLKKNLVVSRTDLLKKIKSIKTDTIINWLLDNQYIIPYKFNPEKLSITPEGIKYHRKISMQLYAKITILTSILPIITVILPLLLKEDISPSEQISLNQTIIDSTFYIRNGNNLNELVKIIESKSSYRFDPSSNNAFEITYSGNIVELRRNYYFYPGGFLVIKYDGDIVRSFDSLRIDKTSLDGSLINVLSDELERRVKYILTHNEEMISDEIISILTDQ